MILKPFYPAVSIFINVRNRNVLRELIVHNSLNRSIQWIIRMITPLYCVYGLWINWIFFLDVQITTLVSAPERPMKAERSRRALGRVGRAVQAAVERFVLVGETIADDNSDIKLEMYEACREARNAGKSALFLFFVQLIIRFLIFYQWLHYSNLFR